MWYNVYTQENMKGKNIMKKLSLLLALLMVFTCCALASCSEEETSSAPEASSTAPATSSTAPESSEAAPESSEEAPESSEEVSTEPEYVKNPDAISTEGNNVAAGKEYTISEQFRMGGADVGWGWDENAAPSYPDEGFELTDGVIPPASYQDAGWMAFNQSTPAQTERGYAYVQFDLGQSYEISEVTIHSLKQTEPGITCPRNIEILVSEDGENWYSASVLELTAELDGLEDTAVHAFTAEMDVTGRYVEIRVISHTWGFLGEIEIK